MVIGDKEGVDRYEPKRDLLEPGIDLNSVVGPPSSARVNQQPPMHQLAVLSTGWAEFFHSAPDAVHHSPFFFLLCGCFSP
jgi:hypothetical protein